MPRSLISCAVVTILLARANPGAAQDVDAGIPDDAGTVEVEAAVEPQAEPVPEPAPVPTSPTKANGFERFALGAYASFGMAALIGNPNDGDVTSASPRFAGGGGAYFDVYLTRNVALDLGLGFLGKGYRFRYESPFNGETDSQTLMLRYLEIPLGAKLDARGFRLSAAIALEIGLADVTKRKDQRDDYTYGKLFWEWNRRVNFGPVIGIGYAIPVGSRFRIVPSVSGSMHVLDENPCNSSDRSCHASSNGRYANVMFHLGAEIGFDGRDAAAPFTAPPPARGYRPFAVGAYMSFGMARSVTTNGVTPGIDDSEGRSFEPRFVGGGGATFDWYLAKVFALDLGVGFVGKGHRFELYDYELRLTYLEIPLGVKLDLKGVRIGLALALEVALAAEEQDATDGDEDTIYGWAEKDWDEFRRVNFGPIVSLGYAFRVGRIAIVPGASWSMDILDDLKTDAYGDGSWRNMTLMFNLGLELGFGGRP